MEPKAFASLSSGLLARKGAARPAMRPQGFGQMGGNMEDLGWNDMGFEPPKPALVPVRDAAHDAFGAEIGPAPIRNPVAGLTPVGSPVHEQQAVIENRLVAVEEPEEVDETAELHEPGDEAAPLVLVAAPEPVAPAVVAPAPVAPVAKVQRTPRQRSVAGAKAKAAFTLRLDPDRHLKLRLACAVSSRSAQQLVTAALDTLLSSMPELDAMARKAARKD
ncbi:hypothetical protein HMF7854_10270 [Sphingomonas ginkgonis]|uniref:Uncharacterized protein n=1 Tax=Sphingomonas ginkgonis TaxID=2315330 RepID=A0A3R9WR17_9SPHN|nr:hypothetical protein HMF7854_10270 [Sphingomonas ginkgonis]